MPEWVVGYHAVLAALERDAARVEVVAVAEGSSSSRGRRVLDAARAAGVRFQFVPRRKLDEVSSGVPHNGFAARLAPLAFADADALLEAPSPCCLLGLDGVEDPHNLGAVIRSAAAFSLAGVVVAGPHPPPLGGAAAKAAAGTMGLLPLAHVGSLGDWARRAKGAGFWVMGAAADGEPVDRAELPDRLVLCIGAEATGLRAKTTRALDGSLSIPLANGVESLNLSVAAAVLAWEWRRRNPAPAFGEPRRPGP